MGANGVQNEGYKEEFWGQFEDVLIFEIVITVNKCK